MLRRIARRELVDIVRDGRFRLMAGLVLGLALMSLAAGWRHYVDVERQHEQARRATRAQWLGQPKKNPHSAAHYGVYAFKPKSRLSLVDTGVDPYVGVAAWLEAHKQNEFRYRPAQDRTALQQFGELTAAQTLLVLIPLFVVLAGFSTYSGEREQGTLRAVLSHGVPPRTLALGKALGVTAALALVVVPALLLVLGAISLTSEFGAVAHDLARGTILAGCFLVYFAIFLALTLGVSARASSSRSALVLLLAFWFVNSLVAARAASDLASALAPAPSSIEFQRAMEAELNDQQETARRLAARKAALLQQHGVSSVDALPVNFRGISLQEGEELGNEVFDRHYGRLFGQYARQDLAARFGGMVAPLLSMRALSMGLAGTDLAHHRDFVTAAEGYRREIQRLLNADIAVNSKAGAVYEAGADLWSKVPEFVYTPPDALTVAGAHLLDLGLLGLWLTAAVAFLARGTAALGAD